jgi:nitroreductase
MPEPQPLSPAADRITMTLGEAIYSLRAIRRHRPDPIPDADLTAILDAAIQAPNGANMQLWHFLVVTDPALRAEFAPLFKEAWWAKRHAAGHHTPEDLPEVYRSPMRLADEIGDSPALVFVCSTVKGLEAANSIVPAVQNLLLTARALGIGGTITTLHPDVEDRVHALFDIPTTAQIVYCIPLGYPRGRFGPVTRKPLEDVTSRDRWGHTPDAPG